MEFLGTEQGRLLVLLAATAMVAVAFVGLRATRPAPRRTVRIIGVGGAGANAIDAMKRAGLRGVEYVAVNTDVAALNRSTARTKIVIGRSTTGGLGTGGDIGVAESAAREAAEAIGQAVDGSDLVVIVAGLGGGTGSGAAPVVAEIVSGRGVLSVAVVTKPFAFEGSRKQGIAEDAEAALAGLVDAVTTIPNDQVRDAGTPDLTVEDAFRAIDEAIHRSVAEIVEMVAVPGRVNLDFADVRAVLRGGGSAAMGFGRAAGESRATEAAREAMAGTRLGDRIHGARSVLVNVSGSRKLRLSELDSVAETILAATGRETNLIFGVSLRPALRDQLQVTVVATGAGAGTPAPTTVAAQPVATPLPAPTPQTVPTPRSIAADVKASIAPPPEADPQPARAFDDDPDAWRPVWLRRAAPPGTPAPDTGIHRAEAKGEPRRSRRKRGKAERASRPDEGA